MRYVLQKCIYTFIHIAYTCVYLICTRAKSLLESTLYTLSKKMEADKNLTNLFLCKVWKKQKENPFKHLLSCHRRGLWLLKQVDTQGHKGRWEVEISALFPQAFLNLPILFFSFLSLSFNYWNSLELSVLVFGSHAHMLRDDLFNPILIVYASHKFSADLIQV